MQFIANGPDIPESLLQAQEAGRVVFFCGAGISYPAALPGFAGLVDAIYEQIGEDKSEIEQAALKKESFDAALDLLERRVQGQRLAVRYALREVLKPNLRLKGATETHQALLRLARQRDGATRLVTTNFDRLFEVAAKKLKVNPHNFCAPLLPVPKPSRWDAVVYLHGMLPAEPSDASLHRLVLTSGDFGLAYLTERWAARFVSELFRQYVVCFVGYSINDPVLRYMMDALAADRMQGESSPQAYAFGDCSPGQEKDKQAEWEAKGVVPILYEPSNGHSALHKTLWKWGETWEEGVPGKESLVVEYALSKPTASTRQDDYVGRMLWALCDETGLPAKRFAEHVPTPSLDWLSAFANTEYGVSDLPRLGVAASPGLEKDFKFSFLRRPAAHRQAPWMSLVGRSAMSTRLDAVMYQMGRWLVRHLNDPELLYWVVEQGGAMSPDWAGLIVDELAKLDKLNGPGSKEKLQQIQSESPNGVPSAWMRVLWRLVLAGKLRADNLGIGLYQWMPDLKQNGLSYALRSELRTMLAPKLRLKKPFRWPDSSEVVAIDGTIKKLVDWEIVVSTDHARTIFSREKSAAWKAALPLLLDDLELLVRDALDLRREVGGADDLSDHSYWDMPSIEPHAQNRHLREWVLLLELLRDSWLAVKGTDKERARDVASRWFSQPYAAFKRMALFAATKLEDIPGETWLGWLLSNDAWWLWTEEARRECMRLLAVRGPGLAPVQRRRLEKAILAGPPRGFYREDIAEDKLVGYTKRAQWHRLAKLESGGFKFGTQARAFLKSIEKAFPAWRLSKDRSDEFSIWMGPVRDVRGGSAPKAKSIPRTKKALIEWLESTPIDDWSETNDPWPQLCKTHPMLCLGALQALLPTSNSVVGRWQSALQVWWGHADVAVLWPKLAAALCDLPGPILMNLAYTIGWGIAKAAKGLNGHEESVLEVVSVIVDLPLEPDTGIRSDGKPINEPVTEALNHPVGNAAQVLLDLWFKAKPNDNDGLPATLEPLFTLLSDVNVKRFRHARVMMCSQLIAFYRVDPEWTTHNLIPLLDWAVSAHEAQGAWEGFLWSPRMYGPLMDAFKVPLLATAEHYADLGQHGQQYASFLAYAGLEGVEGYTTKDFYRAISKLPTEGLEHCSTALHQALEAAGDKQAEYWRTKVRPFWQFVWPKGTAKVTPNISESCARLCIAAAQEFPNAVRYLKNWLVPIEHFDYIVHLLREAKLPETQPRGCLELLNSIVAQPRWVTPDFRACLDEIVQAEPMLKRDGRMRRLALAVRQ